MKTLNIAYPEKSEIKFQVTQFPDGQQDIFITPANISSNTSINVASRFNSFKDLELIICSVAAIKRMGVNDITLTIPYLLGARSDRLFAFGGTSYLVEVIAPIINSLNLKRVCCMDVHSSVAPACIKNLNSFPNSEFVYNILAEKKDFVLICPDKGAVEKMYDVAKAINYKKEIVICSKHRDIATGNIVSSDIGNLVDLQGEDAYIIDDICDGGKTFVEIANKLKLLNPGEINLIITHGIFSKGFDELCYYFNNIYCTNSVKDLSLPFVHQTEVI